MKHLLCVLALAPLCFHSSVHGETKIWTGLSTNLPPKWSDPVNWKPSVPGEKDDVVIGESPYSSQAHIEVAGPIKVKSLSLNRATLKGNAQFEVVSLTSKGAALTEGGTLKITGGASVIRGVTGEFGLLVDGWTVDNEGSLSILENSSINFHGQPGRINNSGTIDLADNTAIDGLSGGGSVVLNSGATRKVQGTGKASINAVRFVNEGQVFVASGNLRFPVGTVINSGTMILSGAENVIFFEGAKVELNGGALTGDGEFVVRGSTVLTVNVDTPIDILNLGSEVTGPANLTVQKHLLWSAGILSGKGQLISVTQLTIEDPVGGAPKFIHGRTLRNQGKALWSNGDLAIDQGGRIENELTGEFTVGDITDKQISGSFQEGGGFFNAGLVKFVKQRVHRTSIYCPFSNSKRVEYASQLLLYGGGVHSGAFVQTEPQGSLELRSSTNHLDDGFTSTSVQPVKIGGGTVNVRGAAKADQLRLDGGTLDGFGDLEISRLFTWWSGTIRGSGVLRILHDARMDWGSFNSQRELLGWLFEIWGFADWDQVNYSVGDNAIIRIMPTGELRLGPSESMQWSKGAIPLLHNRGRVTKPSGNGTAYVGARFVNDGVVIVSQGKLQASLGYTQEGGYTEVDEQAEFRSDRGLTNRPFGKFFGSGRISGGTTNYGMLYPGKSPGILTVGDGLTQGDSGRVQIEIAGRRAGIEFDQVKIEGNAALGGMLEIKLLNGFNPVAGDRFEIMTFQSRTGEFKVKAGEFIGNDLVLVPEYSATSITLVARQTNLLNPLLTLIDSTPDGNRSWGWNTVLTQGYQVEYSNDLLVWFVYTNLTANVASTQLVLPAPQPPAQTRFYRLR